MDGTYKPVKIILIVTSFFPVIYIYLRTYLLNNFSRDDPGLKWGRGGEKPVFELWHEQYSNVVRQNCVWKH